MLVDQRTYTTLPGKVRDYLALYQAEGLAWISCSTAYFGPR